jgi:flagellar biosynthesis/type III secretory pathway chaperone
MTSSNLLKTEISKFLQHWEKIHSIEYVREEFNKHVTNYNDKSKKSDAYEDLKYILSSHEDNMDSISNHLDPLGFHPSDIVLGLQIYEEGASSNDILKAFQELINQNDLTPDDFKRIFELSCTYYTHDVRWKTLKEILKIITQKQLPEQVPFWDELTKSEQKEIVETRGRKVKSPEIKKRVKQYFKTHRERLEKANLDEDGYPINKHVVEQIISELDQELEISKEYKAPVRTITGWVYD